MKCIIIEDNPLDAQLLQSCIHQHCPELRISGLADSIESGYKLICESLPELVFLDIVLPDGNSFEILKQLKLNGIGGFHTIITSSHNTLDNMILTMQFDGLDFIVKPIEEFQLRKSVLRAFDKMQKSTLNLDLPSIINFMNIVGTKQDKKKIAFKIIKGAIEVIDIELITYLEADDKMTIVHRLDGSTFYAMNNIGFYKKILENELQFFQIAKNIIVNTKNVKRFNPYETMITLTNGKNIFASRRGAQDFKRFLQEPGNYLFDSLESN